MSSQDDHSTTMDLHQACRSKDLSLIRSVLERDPEKINNCESSLGWTALYRTVKSGYLEGSKYLLENSGDPNIANNMGDTPLHSAADTSRYELAELLLSYKADPNACQNDGETPLHLSALKGDSQMVKILLEHGANPNIPSSIEGRSPFQYAIEYGHYDCTELMLRFKADLFFKDASQNTALDLATDPKIQELLKNSNEEAVANDDFQLKPLYEWLLKHNMPELYNVLVDAGYDDIRSMVQQMLSPLPITVERLCKIGIQKPGLRRKLVLKLQEEASLVPKKGAKKFPRHFERMLKCCSAPYNTGGYRNIPTMLQWLDGINLAFLIRKFEDAGFDDYEVLLLLMASNSPVTHAMLQEEISIDDPRYRDIILTKLQGDARELLSGNFQLYDEEKHASCGTCEIM